MMKAIPCMLMRGGTSKGAYLLADDLPTDEKELYPLLLKIMGSPDPRQIDGIGGGTFVTSKLAVVNRSKRQGIDIDYKFYQVIVDEPIVDGSPTCGNILSGVGAFAIEKGLVCPQSEITTVRIFDINTGATVTQKVQTPNGSVQYQGSHVIAGVPGAGAAVEIIFDNIAGGKTGHYLPTGNVVDVCAGVEVTCLDVSMPCVFARAVDMGVSGYEDKATLDSNDALLAQIAQVREQASKKMGLGSAKGRVIPKFILLSEPKQGGDINIRYFTPADCHPAVAISGGFCITTGCFIAGTLMNQIHAAEMTLNTNISIAIENPSGITPVTINFPNEDVMSVCGQTVRTTRLLFDGNVFV